MNKEIFISEAFSDETRLRILMLLGWASLSVNCITLSLNLPQPTVSRHLSILKRSELLNCERKGNRSYYSLDFKNSFGSLKKRLMRAYQKELNELEPYISDKKRLTKLPESSCKCDNTITYKNKKKK